MRNMIVYNGTGSTIASGILVAITSSTEGKPAVSPAALATDTHVLGMASQAIGAGKTGVVQISGLFYPIDTSALDPGDEVFLAAAGAISATAPIAGASIRIGIVAVKAVLGTILLTGPAHADEIIV